MDRVVFTVTRHEGQWAVGEGGRYDQLLGLYHPEGKTFPGVGFTINIDELHQVLLPSGQLPLETPMSNWLVVPTSINAYAAAFTYADKIRSSTNLVRVEVDLGGQDSPESVRAYARLRSIGQIAWVNEQGIPEIESLN